MDIHSAFRAGAEKLASSAFGDIHREFGIAQNEWELLTQEEFWTPQQQRQVRSLIASTVEVSLTIAGMPPTPLPVQYVAAVIAIVVAPANQIVAAMKAPDTFDAYDASGLNGAPTDNAASKQQLLGLVMAYAGGFGGEPMPRVDLEVVEIVKMENKK